MFREVYEPYNRCCSFSRSIARSVEKEDGDTMCDGKEIVESQQNVEV